MPRIETILDDNNRCRSANDVIYEVNEPQTEVPQLDRRDRGPPMLVWPVPWIVVELDVDVLELPTVRREPDLAMRDRVSKEPEQLPKSLAANTLHAPGWPPSRLEIRKLHLVNMFGETPLPRKNDKAKK
jgi:hypothetical protein